MGKKELLVNKDELIIKFNVIRNNFKNRWREKDGKRLVCACVPSIP